jgi:hypothetical protein
MESKHLIHHQETREKLAACLEAQHSKIVSMLAWSSIAILCSYLLIIMEAVKIYFDARSGEGWYVIPALILFFLPFVVIVWKILSYVPKESRAVAYDLFHWNVAEYNRQLKWLSGMMIAYFFTVQISCFLLWRYAGEMPILIGGSSLYILGLFLLIRLAAARKVIVNYLRVTERHLYQRRTCNL